MSSVIMLERQPSVTLLTDTAGRSVILRPADTLTLDRITDLTGVGSLTGITDPAFLLVGNAAGTTARKLTPTGWGLSNLLATVPAGRVPFAHTDGTVTSGAGLTFDATASKLTVSGTVAAPTIAATSELVFDIGGNRLYALQSGGFVQGSGRTYGWTAAAGPATGTRDTELTRSSAGFVGIGSVANKVVVGSDGTRGLVQSGTGDLNLYAASGGYDTYIGCNAGTTTSLQAKYQGSFQFNFSGTATASVSSVGHKLVSSALVGWVNSADNPGLSTDTALARNAAGVVEVNNGTAGQYRDLTLRNLRATNVAGASFNTLDGNVTLTSGTASAAVLTAVAPHISYRAAIFAGKTGQVAPITEWKGTLGGAVVASVSAAGLGTFAGLTANGVIKADAQDGAQAVVLRDGGNNNIFRGVTSTAWVDTVATTFFQVGAAYPNIAFTGLSGTAANRTLINSTYTQVGGLLYTGIAAPTSQFEVVSAAAGTVVQNLILHASQTADAFRVTKSGSTLASVSAAGYGRMVRLGLGRDAAALPLEIQADGSGNGLTVFGTGGEFALQQGGVLTSFQVNSSTVPFYFGTSGSASVAGSEVRLITAGQAAVTAKYSGSATQLGFYGATPVARQTVAADATDLATAITLVNDLKAKLTTLGAIQ